MKICKHAQIICPFYDYQILNPISHGVFFGKSTSECLSPILFYSVTYTYKTLEMMSAQSSAANLTNAWKIRKSKIKGAFSAADFFRRASKINGGTQNAVFWTIGLDSKCVFPFKAFLVFLQKIKLRKVIANGPIGLKLP